MEIFLNKKIRKKNKIHLSPQCTHTWAYSTGYPSLQQREVLSNTKEKQPKKKQKNKKNLAIMLAIIM